MHHQDGRAHLHENLIHGGERTRPHCPSTRHLLSSYLNHCYPPLSATTRNHESQNSLTTTRSSRRRSRHRTLAPDEISPLTCTRSRSSPIWKCCDLDSSDLEVIRSRICLEERS